MKNIKRFKGIITGIIIGVVISCTGVYATSKLLASDINFVSNNPLFTANNVNDAINTLYSEAQLKKDIYTKEEVVIGTWIDGNPIYRQVFTGSGDVQNGTVLVKNVDRLINAYGSQTYASSGEPFMFSFANGNLQVRVIKNTQNEVYVRRSGEAISNYAWVLEYTKTTDNIENS